jgi:hypothetical protein
MPETGRGGVSDINNNKIIRQFLMSISSHSNNGIKNVWLILFTAGAIIALRKLHVLLVDTGFIVESTPAADVVLPAVSFLLFFIYFLTFFRFYVGDIRIFDIRYSEVFGIINTYVEESGLTSKSEKYLIEYLKYHDSGLFRFESLFLVFQTVIIAYLAFHILEPWNFLRVYLVLMCVNLAWLSLSNVRFDAAASEIIYGIFGVKKSGEKTAFEYMFPREAGWIWVKNNAVTALIIAVLLFAPYARWQDEIGLTQNARYWIGALVMLGNCLFDITYTRNFYFPKLLGFYVPQIKHPENRIGGTDPARPSGPDPRL